MEGMEQVEMTITKELQIGIGRLPASDFLHLFYEKAEIVLAKLHDVQKNWLLIVQQGQILLDETNLIQYDFTDRTMLAK